VEHRTFSGVEAARRGKTVLYVTERCVFRLAPDGLELTEIAPGVDLQKDILDRMAFKPVMRGEPKLMDERIFRDEPMNLRPGMLARPLSDRLTYDAENNVFYVDFAGLSVRSEEDIERIHQAVESRLAPVGHKVFAIVNYDRFDIAPELVDVYIGMVKGIVERHYHDVTRYTSSTFVRMKLGEALQRSRMAPHLYDNREEALGQVLGKTQ
jgi:propionate CoA-transferase